MGNPFSRGGYVSLKGHTQVVAARFLPNGELVTVGDTSVRLWNPRTGRAEKVWRFNEAAETLCCSPDGRFIACGVRDGLVFVYDARSRQQVAHWQAHADCGQGPLVQFFADSTYLLSAAVYTCKLWSTRTVQLINTWDTTLLTSLHIAMDCTLLAIGSSVGLVTIHSLPDGNAKRQLHAHRAEVWAVAFSPDGSLLVTAARDDAEGLKVWATQEWEMLQVLRGHVAAVLDIGFSPNSCQMVTCSIDRTLRVWRQRPSTGGTPGAVLLGTAASAGSWRCENILVGHGDVVLACAFSPDAKGIVASGARDGIARAWRLADVPQITAADAAAHGVAFP